MAVAFSRLLPAVASAYGLQSLLAALFVPLQSELFFDVGGSLGFLSTTYVSLYYPFFRAKFIDHIPGAVLPALSTFAPRQLLLSAALGVWSARLGSFLGVRAIKAGGDSRFDEIKHRPVRFAASWFMQATWISLVGLPVYLTNALLPASQHPPLSTRDYLALALFASSFLFEVVADRQKAAWRRAKVNGEHTEKFVNGGMWALSRHPNYVGEVGLWTGIWALSTTSLQTAAYPRGSVALAALSPFFTWFITRNLSGVPLLERANDKAFGDDPRWAHYKRSSSLSTKTAIQTPLAARHGAITMSLTPPLFSFSLLKAASRLSG
ncbi:hypothetical protein H0H87_010916 [Tephrocybe sp. NHM501043]|nr:hypothetical protein H0H87_010916 [Tephrocybe sp. NHM501043]